MTSTFVRPPARINFVVGRRRTGGKAEEGRLQIRVGLSPKFWESTYSSFNQRKIFLFRYSDSSRIRSQEKKKSLTTRMTQIQSNTSADTHKMRQTTDEGAHASGRKEGGALPQGRARAGRYLCGAPSLMRNETCAVYFVGIGIG